MGPNDRAQNRKDDRKKVVEETRKRRSHNRGTGEPADWSGVDGTLIAKLAAAVARMGGAVRLGYTRDGGAYAIGIYGDGDPFTEYVPPDGSIEEVLKGMIEDYE